MISLSFCFKAPLAPLSKPSPAGCDGLLLKPEANPLHLLSCDTETKRKAEIESNRESEGVKEDGEELRKFYQVGECEKEGVKKPSVTEKK